MIGKCSYYYTRNTIPLQHSTSITAPVRNTYNVRVHNILSGCTYDTSVNIPGYTKIRAYFAISPAGQCIYSNNAGIEILDMSEGGLQGTWVFGDGSTESYVQGENPSHKYQGDTDTYRLKLFITNEGDCRDSFFVDICVLDTITIFVPEAFSPNQDGHNDYFSIKTGSVTDASLEIYNRWG